MLRPEEMTRAVVVGSMDSLDSTIVCLYELGVLHLIDFTKQDEEFKLGQPLPGASDTSQKLLKLRAMIRSLEIEEHKPGRKLPVTDIRRELEQALVTLDLNTSSKTEARQKIQSLVREKDSEIKALEPFQSFRIPVEDYDGYDSIASFVGLCKEDPKADLGGRIRHFELFKNQRKSDIAIALFVQNDEKLEATRILSNYGFQEVKLPKLKGDSNEIIAKHRSEIKELEADLRRIEQELDGIRKRFADFIIASEEHLAIQVLKAETPLRIATSANSFVMDGWIPTSMMDEVKTALDSMCCGLAFVEPVTAENGEEPPVKLKNPKPVRPFEFFMGLLSTPRYDEVDPTIVLFITFPIFFGFMVGDFGFGVGLVIGGALIRFKFKDNADLRKLGTIILAGGIMASLFGLLVFAEAFGIPFHPPAAAPDEDSWESVANIPIHPLLDKMHDITEMLAISLFAGWLHLNLGFIFGFMNNYRHNKKHAVAKVAWLLVLFGIFIELMTIAGDATATSRFINSTILSPVPDATFMAAGVRASLPALILIGVGVIALPVTEGPIALTEVLGLFTNIMSYMRLAALAVGKGAVALAFNTMFFPLIFDSGNIAIAAIGLIVLVMAQIFFVFILGALSSGIQAIRLNYVEFFLKFFEGGGTDFSPLAYERKYSLATKQEVKEWM